MPPQIKSLTLSPQSLQQSPVELPFFPEPCRQGFACRLNHHQVGRMARIRGSPKSRVTVDGIYSGSAMTGKACLQQVRLKLRGVDRFGLSVPMLKFELINSMTHEMDKGKTLFVPANRP